MYSHATPQRIIPYAGRGVEKKLKVKILDCAARFQLKNYYYQSKIKKMCVGGSMLDPHDTSAAEIQDGGALSVGNEAR